MRDWPHISLSTYLYLHWRFRFMSVPRLCQSDKVIDLIWAMKSPTTSTCDITDVKLNFETFEATRDHQRIQPAIFGQMKQNLVKWKRGVSLLAWTHFTFCSRKLIEMPGKNQIFILTLATTSSTFWTMAFPAKTRFRPCNLFLAFINNAENLYITLSNQSFGWWFL